MKIWNLGLEPNVEDHGPNDPSVLSLNSGLLLFCQFFPVNLFCTNEGKSMLPLHDIQRYQFPNNFHVTDLW